MIFSYLSPYFYTDIVKILLKRREDLGIHQRHKISSKSLKDPAGIALPSSGDAYWFLFCIWCLLLFNFISLYATRDDCFYHACLPSSSLSRVHVWFLPRDACINRGLCRHALSVCLCVCLSVTIVHSVKTGKHIVRLFLPSGKPIILVFPNQTAGLLAILAKSIAIAIAILVGNSIAILSAILYFKNTPSRACAHIYNMALAVIVNCIITSGSHGALTLSFGCSMKVASVHCLDISSTDTMNDRPCGLRPYTWKNHLVR